MGAYSFENGKLPSVITFCAFVYQPDINSRLISVGAKFFAAIVWHFAVTFAAIPYDIRRFEWHDIPGCFVFHIFTLRNDRAPIDQTLPNKRLCKEF